MADNASRMSSFGCDYPVNSQILDCSSVNIKERSAVIIFTVVVERQLFAVAVKSPCEPRNSCADNLRCCNIFIKPESFSAETIAVIHFSRKQCPAVNSAYDIRIIACPTRRIAFSNAPMSEIRSPLCCIFAVSC